MKPSDMSTSRLSAAIDHFIMEHHLEHSLLNDLIEEMEARLRNSIPKPVVGISDHGHSLVLYVNDVPIIANTPAKDFAVHPRLQVVMSKLLAALGINDTEGGE